jgi:hypothetical protein
MNFVGTSGVFSHTTIENTLVPLRSCKRNNLFHGSIGESVKVLISTQARWFHQPTFWEHDFMVFETTAIFCSVIGLKQYTGLFC